MHTLVEAIRSVRRRHRWTQAEFAKILGCSRNTVSRYELGELNPSRSVLLLMLPLTEGAERVILLESLGLPEWEVAGLDSDETQTALRRFENHILAVDVHAKAKKDLVREFAELALEIVRSPERPVTKSFVEILRKWVIWRDMEEARQIFDKLATYLEIELGPHELPSDRRKTDRNAEPESGRRMSRTTPKQFRRSDPGYSSQTLLLMINCETKHLPFYTGFSMTQEKFDDIRIEDQEISCPHCHSVHKWSKKDVFLALPGSM